jgi:hypothetical protein
MLTKTILRMPFCVICSLVPTSHCMAAGKMRKNQLVTGSFPGLILQNNMQHPESIFSVKSPLQGLLSGLLEGF